MAYHKDFTLEQQAQYVNQVKVNYLKFSSPLSGEGDYIGSDGTLNVRPIQVTYNGLTKEFTPSLVKTIVVIGRIKEKVNRVLTLKGYEFATGIDGGSWTLETNEKKADLDCKQLAKEIKKFVSDELVGASYVAGMERLEAEQVKIAADKVAADLELERIATEKAEALQAIADSAQADLDRLELLKAKLK